jgi:oxygen-independent coproporphyrinogen-3 oxidase
MRTVVEPSERRFEFLMNALRLREGFRESLFHERTGLPSNALEPELTRCIEAGLLEQYGGYLRCTSIGFNFLDNLLQRFLS